MRWKIMIQCDKCDQTIWNVCKQLRIIFVQSRSRYTFENDSSQKKKKKFNCLHKAHSSSSGIEIKTNTKSTIVDLK